jgi:hypothetical protein
MKARHLKRRHVERLRWRLLIERVVQGVEGRLVDWLAQQWARAAAAAVTNTFPLGTDLIRTMHQELGRSLAQVQALRNATC